MTGMPEKIWIEDDGVHLVGQREGFWTEDNCDQSPHAYTRSDLAQQAWRPIESAPYDTPVIIFVPWERNLIGEAVRDKENDAWRWANTNHGDQTFEWIEAGWSAPTHWMPLPSAPTETKE